MKPLKITRPQLDGATPLTPLEMNQLTFDRKHTVLTPEVLEEAAKQRAAKS